MIIYERTDRGTYLPAYYKLVVTDDTENNIYYETGYKWDKKEELEERGYLTVSMDVIEKIKALIDENKDIRKIRLLANADVLDGSYLDVTFKTSLFSKDFHMYSPWAMDSNSKDKRVINTIRVDYLSKDVENILYENGVQEDILIYKRHRGEKKEEPWWNADTRAEWLKKSY